MIWSHTSMDEHRRMWKAESGIGFIETLLALGILTVGFTAVLSLFAVSTAYNHEQGNVGSRTTTFAEAKMEELLSLAFTDSATNTAVWPPAGAGGTGLCGTLGANASCGGVDPATQFAGVPTVVNRVLITLTSRSASPDPETGTYRSATSSLLVTPGNTLLVFDVVQYMPNRLQSKPFAYPPSPPS